MHARKDNFQARQAERKFRSPRSQNYQSPVAGTPTGRVLNTEQEPPSVSTLIGRVPAASEWGREPGDV